MYYASWWWLECRCRRLEHIGHKIFFRVDKTHISIESVYFFHDTFKHPSRSLTTFLSLFLSICVHDSPFLSVHNDLYTLFSVNHERSHIRGRGSSERVMHNFKAVYIFSQWVTLVVSRCVSFWNRYWTNEYSLFIKFNNTM